MYVYQNFSKADKKNFEPLLELAIRREIANFAKEALPMHQDLAKKSYEDIRVPYWELAEKFKDFSKHLTRTYDGYSHRTLPSMIAGFIVNGDLNMEDLADFSEAGKKKLEEMIAQFRSWRE